MYSHAERRNDQVSTILKPGKINCGSCRASARLRWRTGRRHIHCLTGPLRSLAKARQLLRRNDRSHALRGNATSDALRPADDARFKSCAVVTRSVTGCIPTQSVGTIRCASLGRSIVGAVELQRGCDGGLAGNIFIARQDLFAASLKLDSAYAGFCRLEMIVPTLCVGMPLRTLCVQLAMQGSSSAQW